MMNVLPKVSVVMAVYNGGDYLRSAVESILQQSFTDFEFIIINDGSTDSSLDILYEYAERDERIRIISRENKGLVASLNQGIAEARAPLIARMDADDIAYPERLKKQYQFMEIHSDVVCIGSYYEIIDEDGLALNIAEAPVGDDEIQEALMRGHTVICHPTAMYRTSIAEAVGGYEQRFFLVEDLDLWIKLGEQGKLGNIPEVLLGYRTNSDSVSTINGKTQLDRAESVIIEASHRRGVENKFELKKHWRPDETIKSKIEFSLKYGWWAYNYKNRDAAIKYAKRTIGYSPWCIKGWKLLVLSFFKLKHR